MGRSKRKVAERSAPQVLEALRRRFSAPEWVLFEEVGNATGFECKRHADAVAMCTWPSKGLELVGFEVKVSRGDWMRELEQPEKSADMIRHLDRWYIAAPTGLIDVDELPLMWGLVQVSEKGEARVKKPAPLIKDWENNRAPDVKRSFLAAVLRQAHDFGEQASRVAKARREGYAEGRKSATEAGKELFDNAMKREAATQQLITTKIEEGLEPLRDLEEALGEPIRGWDTPRAVAILRAAGRFMDRRGEFTHVCRLEKRAEQALEAARALKTAFEATE